jgi:hypothetical protein
MLLLCFTEGHLVYANALPYEKPNPILQQLNKIQASINHADWKKAETEAKQLEHIYKKNVWKLQLLGDEAEFEAIHRDISQLKAAIQEQDKAQTKVLIAEITAILEDIYSL